MRRGRFIACTWAVLVAAATPARAAKSYKVAITTEPAGATVRIDDPDADPEGTTPCELELAPGPYMVILTLDGYQQRIEEITVKKTRKKQKFEFELEAIPMGHLDLVADGDAAEGASVRVDGKIAGRMPTTVDVAEGPHELVVVKEGYRRFEKWIEVGGGANQSVSVALHPEGEETPVVHEKKHGPELPRTEPLVVASAGVEVAWRRWYYANPQSDSARSFDTSLVPIFRGALEAYPLAGSKTAFLRGLGVRGAAGLGLPPPVDPGAGSIDTGWQELEAGGVYRLRLSDAAEVRADVSYDRLRFSFKAPGMYADYVPDVDYRCVRFGASARYTSGRLRFGAGGSYLGVRSAGLLAQRFRSASSQGMMFSAGVDAQLLSRVQAGVSVSYRRFSFDFTSNPGDAVEADGGTDIYFGVLVGAAYLY